MRLLREYVRELLTEAAGIDPKIVELIDRAEELGYKLKFKRDYLIMFDPVKVEIKGKIRFEKVDPILGPCADAVMIGSSSAQDNLGPLMYDVVIEYSGGLISDRSSVTPEARSVWDRYMNGRPDVEAVQLDDPFNSLTPDDGDNCDQEVAGGRHSMYGGERDRGTDWVKSSLSKLYKKSGTPVMDELRKRGMLK